MFFVLGWLLFSLFPLEAQSESYRFTHLSMEEGLSSNSVFCMAQDRYGFMWFGTFSGLCRYDGRSITVYRPEPENPHSLSASVIFSIWEDSFGDLWIGTDGGGLNRFDRETEEFHTYRHDPNDSMSLASDQVFALLEDRMGWLWVGTGGSGLDRYDRVRDRFYHYKKGPGSLPSDTVRCLLEDSHGTVWVGTAGGGLAKYNRETDGFDVVLDGVTVRALFEDSKGNLWVGTEQRGVFVRETHADSFKNPLTNTTVRAILEDDNGRIWLGTDSDGIAVYDPPSKTLSWIKKSDVPRGLSGNWIRSLYKDRGGLIWVGTRDAGINRYNPLSVDFQFLPTEHTPRQIYTDSSGIIWFGTDGGGLFRWNPATGQLSSYTSKGTDPHSLSSNLVYSIVEDGEGNLWVGTDGGGLNLLYRGSEKFERFVHDPQNPSTIGSNNVWAVYVDSRKTLWIGTELGGLSRWVQGTRSFVRYRSIPGNPNSLNGNSVRAILEDSKGTLWIGTWDGGLSRYRPESDDFVQYKRIPGDPSSLGDNSVNCIFEDSTGTLWVGTSGGGLNRMYGNTGVFSHITKKQGLSGDNVFGIQEDEDGFLWISTEGGLSRYDPRSGSVLNFSEPDGLLKNEFSQKSFGKGKDGTLFFGGPRGISYFSPKKIRVRYAPAPVRITHVLLFDEPVPVGKKIHGYTALQSPVPLSNRLELSWKDSVLSFQFAVLDYTDPERNQYAMKIDGLHEEWLYLGSRNNALITALRPGKYTLRVKGANHQGVWNTEETFLAIVVHPPFWETPLFRFLMVGALIASGWSLYRYRTFKLEQKTAQLRRFSMHIQDVREEERKHAAREIHDGLGQYLAVLKMDTYWVRSHLGKETKLLEEKLQGMLDVLEEAMRSVKDITTRLRPQVLDHFNFLEAIRWQVQDFRKHCGIEVNLSLPSEPVDVPPEVARNLFRIFQEILTNIMKHAQATRVEVSLQKENGKLRLQVIDNGRGIRPEEIENEESFGILGIRERCSYLGGSVEISGTKGTKILLLIPLINQEV
ncbi:MAG: histidine kinase [Spirochaetes bacterium]|nr:histidine kinase [Spirochaetota bacterium]